MRTRTINNRYPCLDQKIRLLNVQQKNDRSGRLTQSHLTNVSCLPCIPASTLRTTRPLPWPLPLPPPTIVPRIFIFAAPPIIILTLVVAVAAAAVRSPRGAFTLAPRAHVGASLCITLPAAMLVPPAVAPGLLGAPCCGSLTMGSGRSLLPHRLHRGAHSVVLTPGGRPGRAKAAARPDAAPTSTATTRDRRRPNAAPASSVVIAA